MGVKQNAQASRATCRRGRRAWRTGGTCSAWRNESRRMILFPRDPALDRHARGCADRTGLTSRKFTSVSSLSSHSTVDPTRRSRGSATTYLCWSTLKVRDGTSRRPTASGPISADQGRVRSDTGCRIESGYDTSARLPYRADAAKIVPAHRRSSLLSIDFCHLIPALDAPPGKHCRS